MVINERFSTQRISTANQARAYQLYLTNKATAERMESVFLERGSTPDNISPAKDRIVLAEAPYDGGTLSGCVTVQAGRATSLQAEWRPPASSQVVKYAHALSADMETLSQTGDVIRTFPSKRFYTHQVYDSSMSLDAKTGTIQVLDRGSFSEGYYRVGMKM